MVHTHPHCRGFFMLNAPEHCPLLFRTVLQLNFSPTYAVRPKNQNGLQVLGMVRPTFFLWEINQKFFFLSLSFHILVTRNKNFCPPGGSQWAPGGLLAHFGPKKAIFEQFSIKFYFFLRFKIFLYFKTIKKFI